MVYREVCTEGSETAKSGTDEQELNMRHNRTDEVAQHTDVQAQEVKYLLCRFSRHRRKEKALTGGGLGIDSVSMCQEVSRGHSSYWIRATIDTWRPHRSNEGLNDRLPKIR